MTAYDRILLPENLNYAWLKAKRLYWMADGYIDNGELAEFELDLERRLIGIRRQFERGVWRLKKLRPLPRPKKIENDVPYDRQYYHVAVDDQVAWIAVANALGPELDQHMPPWSYGNRIYRPAWYEHGEDQQSTLEIGPYRHASGHLYRKFQYSWPLFRRHVALTARKMARALPADWEELDQADRLAAIAAEKEGLPYLQAEFWKPRKDQTYGTDLYHAAIDLKQFYPSLRTEAVLKGLASAGSVDDRMQKLLAGMVDFRLDKAEMPPHTLNNVEPGYDRLRVRGIPTGLFVAGFLANVAMLPVDAIVNRRILEQRSLAHFRFVDDHIFLAYNFEELCNWLDWYRDQLVEFDTGAEVNVEKYDPASLGQLMDTHAKALTAAKAPTGRAKDKAKTHQEKYKAAAIRDTRIDGANPITLLTKTLGQISAIAATNIDILDDEDLEERLKLLEWLLLANIPEREIRPDTRAAFAAGQIAALAPILVPEADGLIDAVRSLEILKAQAPRPETATQKEIDEHKTAVEKQTDHVAKLQAGHEKGEEHHLHHCFGLLLQAFREYPGKPRLFYRVHEYCRVTGFRGLREIANWIREVRKRGHAVWANYYTGLSLHILARGAFLAVRTLRMEDALRSDKKAALSHLYDISHIAAGTFRVPRETEAWFHAVSRKEFGVALLSVAEVIRHTIADTHLSTRLNRLASQYVRVSFDDPAEDWKQEAGRGPGVWAHLAESFLSVDDRPSPAWKRFEPLLSYSHLAEVRAVRRYPEILSDHGWYQLLHSKKPMPETDSGWLRDAMAGNDGRIAAARSSSKLAFSRAARSLLAPSHDWMTLEEWTRLLLRDVSPFDPRRSEWTALEVVRQFVSPIVDELGVQQASLDRLHPNNVLVPEAWMKKFRCERHRAGVNWETWRDFAQSKNTRSIKLRDSATSVLDYRYFTETQGGHHINEWERRLIRVGRLLLGLLRLNHEVSRMWNIRGNEQVFALPRTRWFRSLAISSSTLLLMEGCLSARSAETLVITLNPGLFGWKDGLEPNDVDFDPPLLIGPNELLSAIGHAQDILKDNQLAVAMNQPRQLIPYRLSDFAAGQDGEGEADGYGE